MPTTAAVVPAPNCVIVDRKRFLAVLDRVRAVVPTRFTKPILTGVRLESADGALQLSATDGEIKLLTQVETEGHLPLCVVSCAELARRLKVSKGDTCTLSVRTRPPRLVVNGGCVEHTLPGMLEEDFPPIPDRHEGDAVALDAEEFRTRLAAVGHAMAREPSRYAINGLLLESDKHGVRLVATDGRRLAVAELDRYDTTFQGQIIIPARVVKLIEKFAARETVPLVVAAKPNTNDKGEKLPVDLYVAGPDWLLFTPEAEGRFPLYRDVIPTSQSKFVVDRRPLIETLQEVALASSHDSNMVRVDLTPRRIQLSAKSPEVGESVAKLPARFIGEGDGTIHAAFNPAYLLDALKSLDGEQVVIDIGQNGCGCDGKVFGKPAVLYPYGNEATRCVVMPVNAGLPATRENLGSNYREDAA
jgi:DNA polymerase-3 subunit beta